jgi:hypothetical protein
MCLRRGRVVSIRLSRFGTTSGPCLTFTTASWNNHRRGRAQAKALVMVNAAVFTLAVVAHQPVSWGSGAEAGCVNSLDRYEYVVISNANGPLRAFGRGLQLEYVHAGRERTE